MTATRNESTFTPAYGTASPAPGPYSDSGPGWPVRNADATGYDLRSVVTVGHSPVSTDAEISMDQATQRSMVQQSVVAEFSQSTDVGCIYLCQEGDMLAFTVFIHGEKYDDQMMDRLLAKEVKLLRAWKDCYLDFRYVPLVLAKPVDAVSYSASLIYKG